MAVEGLRAKKTSFILRLAAFIGSGQRLFSLVPMQEKTSPALNINSLVFGFNWSKILSTLKFTAFTKWRPSPLVGRLLGCLASNIESHKYRIKDFFLETFIFFFSLFPNPGNGMACPQIISAPRSRNNCNKNKNHRFVQEIRERSFLNYQLLRDKQMAFFSRGRIQAASFELNHFKETQKHD